MNRKERLRIIKTPDTSLIRDDYNGSMHFSLLQNTINKDEVNEMPSQQGSHFISAVNLVRDCIPHVIFMSIYTIFMYFILRPNDDKPLLALLIKELEKMKEENGNLIATLESSRPITQYNFAKLEMGTRIDVDQTILYKYGLFGFRKYNDPYAIFNDDNKLGECLTISGSKGKFRILFSRPIYAVKFCLYHPDINDYSSALRDFVIRGVKEKSVMKVQSFSFTGRGLQEFALEEALVDTIEIEVMSNHGNKKFTCIYKVIIIGHREDGE